MKTANMALSLQTLPI